MESENRFGTRVMVPIMIGFGVTPHFEIKAMNTIICEAIPGAAGGRQFDRYLYRVDRAFYVLTLSEKIVLTRFN